MLRTIKRSHPTHNIMTIPNKTQQIIRACHHLEGRTLLKRILARYKKKNVLSSCATEVRARVLNLLQDPVSPVIFRRSRSLKDERPRAAVRRKGTREEDQKKLFFLIDDTP